MTKIALITGSTDGIGKATAITLAKNGYTVHVLGRNIKKGELVLQNLKTISSKPHQFFQVDLSTVQSNVDFLNKYISVYNKLNLLILNALAFPEKEIHTSDGLEQTFAVGYLSRYIFSIMLEPILQNTNDSRVIHIGQGSKTGNIHYDKLKKIQNNGKKYNLIEKTKITFIPYIADGTFTHFVNRQNHLKTSHEYYHPGTVDTQQIKASPKWIQWLGKVSGEIIQPEESGKLLFEHISNTTSKQVAGKYYSKGQLKKTSTKMKNAIKNYTNLITFSQKETNIYF